MKVMHNAKKIILYVWLKITQIIFFVLKKENKELLKLKNKHVGERVFIVATGPSLTKEDLDLIKNEKSISMNGIVDMFSKTSYRPTYFLIQDAEVIKKRAKSINESDLNDVYVGIGNSYFTKMNTSKKIAKKIKKNKIKYNLNSNYHIFEMYYNPDKMKVKFSDNFAKQSFDGCTVAYSAIQFAYYLGFREIYLLGCDCTYGGYFNEKSDLSNVVKPIYFKAYEEAKKFSIENDLKIYNCTRGGMLEVFERKNLEDILNGK